MYFSRKALPECMQILHSFSMKLPCHSTVHQYGPVKEVVQTLEHKKKFN